MVWKPENNRVDNILLKLVRGHVAYEHRVQRIEDPKFIDKIPIHLFTKEESEQYYSSSSHRGPQPWPEVVSRAFMRLIGEPSYNEWNVVQEGLYEYPAVLFY